MIPKVAVIIVNWNGKIDTLACLESLRNDNYPNKRIIVVDNGSCDDSVVAFRAAYPGVTVVEAGRNLGFTGGNNLGLKYVVATSAEYVYLLNNDTTSEPGALSELIMTAERHGEFGLLSPVICYFDEPRTPWFAGSRMELSRGIAVHDNARIPGRSEPAFEVPWASGCAMLIRGSILKKLRGFDDRYFLNWEDVDLCIRLRNAGYRVGLVPGSRIYHKVARSFGKTQGAMRYYHVRNNLLLLRLHSGRGYARAVIAVLVDRLRENLRGLKRRESGAMKSLVVTAAAFLDHMRRRYGPRHDRSTRTSLNKVVSSDC